MPPVVLFRPAHSWAIVPERRRVDRAAAKDTSAAYRKSFRHVRAERRPEHCAPWVMGQELGWRIPSPIDVTLSPLDQIEVASDGDPRAAAGAAARAELWQRERSSLAVDRTSWLHLYQFRTEAGWENMFLPNGAGSVEWHLGWNVELPRGYFLLVAPLEDGPPGLDIPTGVMSSTVCSRMNEGNGFGIAIRPTTSVTLSRGQHIARLILLHADSLQASSTTETADHEDDEHA
ncbi:hypothetical protein [Streptomyces sp. NPDC001422]|uniref:hypothetical protein n=1 Tax=Streptomyces sp. NPDC001422 TaxID=3364575 RepID=UPI00367F3626